MELLGKLKTFCNNAVYLLMKSTANFILMLPKQSTLKGYYKHLTKWASSFLNTAYAQEGCLMCSCSAYNTDTGSSKGAFPQG